MDYPSWFAQTETVEKELTTREGEIHDYPIKLPWYTCREMMRVREHGEHIVRAVLGKVCQHQQNCLRVDIGRDNEYCPCRKGNCERSDTGKHIEDGLVISHPFKNTLPF
jgi:hypothetical protein